MDNCSLNGALTRHAQYLLNNQVLWSIKIECFYGDITLLNNERNIGLRAGDLNAELFFLLVCCIFSLDLRIIALNHSAEASLGLSSSGKGSTYTANQCCLVEYEFLHSERKEVKTMFIDMYFFWQYILGGGRIVSVLPGHLSLYKLQRHCVNNYELNWILIAFHINILKTYMNFSTLQWCFIVYYFSSKKLDTEPLELFEIAVKELTFDQLQLLKVLLLFLVWFTGCGICSLDFWSNCTSCGRTQALKVVQVEQVVNFKHSTLVPSLQLE